MSRFFAFIFLITFISNACTNTSGKSHIHSVKKVKDDFNVNIKIPSNWIEKVRHYNYNQDNAALLKEFENIAKPLFVTDGQEQTDKEREGILNPMFTNLDGESENELICLMGWSEEYPSIGVFKEIQGDWYLLYLEPFYMFYAMPEFAVTNNYSKNKTFYLRRMNEHGSGVYSDSYSFYKLINNKVYKGLDLINEARIEGWGLFMNQDVKMKFSFNGGNADEIWVWYAYNFFAGAVNEGDCSWCSNNGITMVKDEHGMNYRWDSLRMAYTPEISANQDPAELTLQKIACFGNFGNDSLFVHAFHFELDQTLKNGTVQQKKILKQYLALVKKNGHATTDEMEETMETGGTKFYRPKREK